LKTEKKVTNLLKKDEEEKERCK